MAAANVMYSSDVLAISKHATKFKFGLAYFLRFLDGTLSLTVNYLVMLQTEGVLGILLNFAALHFLQDVDDVFYELAEKGFFGDAVEDMVCTCKKIELPRRETTQNGCSKLKTELDTILYFFAIVVLYVIYGLVVATYIAYDLIENDWK